MQPSRAQGKARTDLGDPRGRNQSWLARAPESGRRPAGQTRPEPQATVAQDAGKARPDSESRDPRQGMPVGPGRRRLGRLESGAGESAAAVTHLLDKAPGRAGSGDR